MLQHERLLRRRVVVTKKIIVETMDEAALRREQLRKVVDECAAKCHELASNPSAMTFAAFESALFSQLFALGRALVAVFLATQAARLREARYEYQKKKWAIGSEQLVSALGTRFGKVQFIRPIGRRDSSRRGACDAPVDRELGLGGGFSPATAISLVRICTQMAFAPARAEFRAMHEWAPSEKATLRMVDAVGSHARAFLEQSGLAEADGEVIVIQVDAKGVRRITEKAYELRCRPHRRNHAKKGRRARRQERKTWLAKRKQGRSKSKNAKMAYVGIVYSVRKTDEGYEGPINKRILATFESHDALFRWLKTKAVERGYGRKRTLFLSDGADAISACRERYLPEAEALIDPCHVFEKLWDVAAILFPRNANEQDRWMEKMIQDLMADRVEAVIVELRKRLSDLPRRSSNRATKAEAIENVIKYIAKRRRFMRYKKLREEGLEIASGAIEGAVKSLVGARLDGSGMQWGGPRAELVLHLRCILLAGQWNEFVDWLSAREIRLAPQQIRAEPYAAKEAA
jgi:hypothetical protein